MPTTNPDHLTEASQVTKLYSLSCQCLWQPCNRNFTPSHPAQVFCDEPCRQLAVQLERAQARRRARRKANQKYRPTARGRAKHRESCKAYRLRKKELAATAQRESSGMVAELAQANSPREGDINWPKIACSKKSSCRRPGCEVEWEIDPRSPHKKHCSSLCNNALRAAAVRVERYYKGRGCVGAITRHNRLKVLLAKPGSRGQLRSFESAVLRC